MDNAEPRRKALRDRLVRDGMAQLSSPPGRIMYTGDGPADDLLNDLAGHPHAFVLACLMDRQVTAERAWQVPWVVRERLGSATSIAPFLDEA